MLDNNKNELERAHITALRLLSFCDRSRKDLKERLSKKGYSTEAVEKVLEHLESMGYIDDERFAMKFALDAVKRKNAGPGAIRYGLERKGIQRGIIEETVSKVFQDYDEKEVARRALSKRLNATRNKTPMSLRDTKEHENSLPPVTLNLFQGLNEMPKQVRHDNKEVFSSEIKKLSAYLRRKGFSYDIMKKILRGLDKEDDI